MSTDLDDLAWLTSAPVVDLARESGRSRVAIYNALARHGLAPGLRDDSDTCSVADVMDALGVSRSQVARLASAGRIERAARGRFTLVSVDAEVRRRTPTGLHR